jgi:hypothetical protein
MDLLDDIWGISTRFQEEMVGNYPPEAHEFPLIVWAKPRIKGFSGVSAAETTLSPDDFAKVDDRVRALDISNKITIPAHYQLSPTSLTLFKKCPLRFYFKYQLGIPEGSVLFPGEDGTGDLWEDKDGGETVESRIIGTIVHAYLERHCFGSPLDEDLLASVFATHLEQEKETILLQRRRILEIRNRVRELIGRAVNDDTLLEMLSGVAQYNELPFAFNGSGYTLRGRIDKLCRSKETDAWAIIDWKTGELQGNDPVASAVENHFDLQLACYRLVVEDLKNAPVHGTFLYYASLGKLIQVDYGADPQREIDELIGFIESYRVSTDKGEIRKLIKKAKSGRGECITCGYHPLGIC